MAPPQVKIFGGAYFALSHNLIKPKLKNKLINFITQWKVIILEMY